MLQVCKGEGEEADYKHLALATVLMDNYIEWTGTEKCLEDLLIWWGAQIPWEHSPDCDRDQRAIHCCEGISEFKSSNFIRGASFERSSDEFMIIFGDWQGNQFPVEIGDRLHYRGLGIFELTDSENNVKSSRV